MKEGILRLQKEIIPISPPKKQNSNTKLIIQEGVKKKNRTRNVNIEVTTDSVLNIVPSKKYSHRIIKQVLEPRKVLLCNVRLISMILRYITCNFNCWTIARKRDDIYLPFFYFNSK